MIIKSYNLKKNLNQNINFFLLYGNNKGLIRETIETTFVPPIFSKNVIKYEENEIINNVETFHEGILNKSFFDDEKLIIINRATDKILEIIKEIIEKKIQNLKIVSVSGNLEKKSKLRNYFEKNTSVVVVPFYEDNHQTLLLLASKFLKEKKIDMSQQNVNLIIEKTKGDRINLFNELEKIHFFKLSGKKIDDDIILKLTNLAENYNVSELVDNCLIRNKKKTLNILNENISSQEDNILILKTFLFKLKRLKQLKIEIESKKNTDLVVSSYKPPIFWKDKDLIKQQLKTLSLYQIKKLINEVNSLELLIKQNTQIANQITNNFILEKLELTNN
tara:strand:- start:848 stop:1846 length:999 start_codon:yes stop_codon:yes gene_type:complete